MASCTTAGQRGAEVGPPHAVIRLIDDSVSITNGQGASRYVLPKRLPPHDIIGRVDGPIPIKITWQNRTISNDAQHVRRCTEDLKLEDEVLCPGRIKEDTEVELVAGPH
ncbi:MAG: hypothetical protein WD738_24625 [Pirellulales bacterium]